MSFWKRPRQAEPSARAKFLQALQQYASDDEGEETLGGGPLHRPSRDATPTTTTMKTGNMFDDAEEVPPVAPPRSIGMQLLQGMHKDVTSSSTDRKVAGGETNLKVVEAYVPLSSGGFLDTSADHGAGRPIKVGDVMCAVIPVAANVSVAAQGGGGFPLSSPPTSSNASPTARQPPQTAVGPLPSINGGGVQRSGSPERPPFADGSPTTTAPPGSPASAVAAATAAALKHFRSEAELTEEERRYGKHLHHSMVQQLFEVSRWDPAKGTMEALFLDGRRAKLRVHEVRPAGYVENALYQQWKEDPASQPVLSIGVASPLTGPSSDVQSPHHTTGSHSVGSPSPQCSPLTTTVAGVPTPWWVLPNLVVRVVTEAAGEWLGRRCVVVAVWRKANTVRVMNEQLWLSPPSAATSSGVVDIVGVEGLETVLPKKGESGVVVLGPHRGEMVTVTARSRDETGNLTALVVQCHRTKEVLQFAPEELCVMARRLQ